MLRTVLVPLLIIILFLPGFNLTKIAKPEESIVIIEKDKIFEISVPVSRLILSLPKLDFSKTAPPQYEGGTASPRYFFFVDRNKGIRLSGWFEPAQRFAGVEEPPPAEVDGIPLLYKNIRFEKIGDWDIVSYDVLYQSNKVANIRAHLVRAGTWIELHISGNLNEPLTEQHFAIREILRAIQIHEKS